MSPNKTHETGPYVITLVGRRGCGKTSCALQLAHWLQSSVAPEFGRRQATGTQGAGKEHGLRAAVFSDVSECEATWPLPLSQTNLTFWDKDSILGAEPHSTHKLVAAARHEATYLDMDVLIVDSRELGAQEDPNDANPGASLVVRESDLVLLLVDCHQGA